MYVTEPPALLDLRLEAHGKYERQLVGHTTRSQQQPQRDERERLQKDAEHTSLQKDAEHTSQATQTRTRRRPH